MIRLRLLSTLLLAAAALIGLAQASVVVPLDLDQMTDQADSILVGTCNSKHSYWKDKKIWTDATFQVERRVKGNPSHPLVIRQLGGSVLKPVPLAMKVSGLSEFEIGETALLFMKRRPDGAGAIVGLSQGHVRLTREPRTGKWTSPNGRFLDDLLSRIENRLKESAQR
ncbi:MAG: hypothetical protein V3U86_13150 [Acidobacteriota bacterium]